MASANPQWDFLKPEIQKTWSRITGEELDLIAGDFTALENLIHQKYGLAPVDSRNKIEELKATFRRDLKKEKEAEPPPVEGERDGVRGTLRDQYRQF